MWPNNGDISLYKSFASINGRVLVIQKPPLGERITLG